MRESLRKTEAKYFPDLGQSTDLDQSKFSDLDSISSDDFVYV